MHNLSYNNEFYLHVNENSFSYEKLYTKHRFENEAQDNSDCGLLPHCLCLRPLPLFCILREVKGAMLCYFSIFLKT